jgi:predicted nuclease of predicted toxin-antitoxin system
VRFLIDESLSARVAYFLEIEGHDTIHVGELGLLGAPDTDVMRSAVDSERIVVSADTDFGELLAVGRHPGPSVVLFRRAPHRPEEQARLLLASLAEAEESLMQGAVVVVSRDRVRIRLLPIT